MIVEFVIHLRSDVSDAEAKIQAERIKTQIYLESNSTRSTDFHREFPVDLASIAAKPCKSGHDNLLMIIYIVDCCHCHHRLHCNPSGLLVSA